MEDKELTALKKLREKLLLKASDLFEELKKQERNQQKVIIRQWEPCTVQNTSNIENKAEQYEHKLCEISQKMSGIAFKDIDRKWINNNLYQYTTLAVINPLKFHVELLVKIEREKEFEICSIKCDYININKCYRLEIDPCIQNIIKMKNFSLLTSAMVHYTEQNMIRKKIIDNLRVKNYLNYELCMDDNGGIIINVHSPENVQQTYLKMNWTILFVERIWKHEHYFVIDVLEAGDNFAEENRMLLEEFCEPMLTKQNLIDLWKKLCSVLDSYEVDNSAK
ncbi:uncharacterized protein LOC114880652 isoform X1 [Osmia bicornis bicornis]|uniref:uncharacterized protein LOC114880652 isoform X1 n=1 Tax=Osmia bicornis bicornis TaxID=1437191 RepID=UPI0010FA0835|nr:uncharacterized protein LOC114880652 isoform X1 [Osmia bicornis bicornis]XP_029052731.1 uncharacterized protein LOC114880652 isoform X1 [Osmia bicornis bicornis]XP_029052732.1 uncharacterized protein LOC114880652 isoform X1 [Osmia bicornis bicornis]XP_029052733.1 uncharacterized protein LOC114880652 isoform X1 [Osmia bicornis bicornis]XP_029052735.1 uncharacterized protein LOC114880652 isoform X1 [Osmia bicornis bicornis]